MSLWDNYAVEGVAGHDEQWLEGVWLYMLGLLCGGDFVLGIWGIFCYVVGSLKYKKKTTLHILTLFRVKV